MMWVGFIMLMTTSLFAAQGPPGRICKCTPYYDCVNHTWHMTAKCPHYNEVCCERDPITTATEVPVPPTSQTLTSIQETTQPSSPKPRSDPVCGVRNKLIEITEKINLPPGVQGNTQFGEFPWMAAIIKNTPQGQKYVGGSIIYPNLILTAAHSIKDIPASELLVTTGMWNTTDLTEVFKHQNRSVLQIVLHPGFEYNTKFKMVNDFALLVLNQSLKITENVSPVCLPFDSMPTNESSCIATGWGADKNGKNNGGILKKVVLPMIDFGTCQSKMKAYVRSSFQLHESFICAGDGNQEDTCVGDGGGPLMCASKDNPDQFVQVGITSWGFGCSNGVPGAYSSVKAATNWIKGVADSFPPSYEK